MSLKVELLAIRAGQQSGRQARAIKCNKVVDLITGQWSAVVGAAAAAHLDVPKASFSVPTDAVVQRSVDVLRNWIHGSGQRRVGEQPEPVDGLVKSALGRVWRLAVPVVGGLHVEHLQTR